MKKIFLSVLAITFIMITVLCTACNKMPYSLKAGAYNYEYATLTNLLTEEVTVKHIDELFSNSEDYDNWGKLLDYQIIIKDDSEYFRSRDNRYFVLNEGLAFEVISDDKLQLHLPFWTSYNYYPYDIVIILNYQIRYC